VSSVWTLADSVSRVELVKIDTEGAEVPALEELLPYAKQGLVGAIVVELMPYAWTLRGTSLKRGLKALQSLGSVASAAYLIYDPTPWGFNHTRVDDHVPYIKGPLTTAFSWDALVEDRTTKGAGCNAYFVF
jgi:hypothetical protein